MTTDFPIPPNMISLSMLPKSDIMHYYAPGTLGEATVISFSSQEHVKPVMPKNFKFSLDISQETEAMLSVLDIA
jgi:hypothetical protein